MATQTTLISELKFPKQFMVSSPTQTETTCLRGWEEIAAYIRRAVRTVQRWERSAGLPVHRPRTMAHRDPVFAFAEELDVWLHSRPTRSR